MDINSEANTPSCAALRAIVAVDSSERVQCQEPGCGHSVYAAVHIVEEDGRLMVLGSTCFEKRYGSRIALGSAGYGTGNGRKLTAEERDMLVRNTAALLSRFQDEEAAVREQLAREIVTSKTGRPFIPGSLPQIPPARRSGFSTQPLPRSSPWAWQKVMTSIAVLTSPDGKYWIRVQHQDGSQKLVPWPKFSGWETALPHHVGLVDTALGAIAVENIVEAIGILKNVGFQGPVVGSWKDVLPRI